MLLASDAAACFDWQQQLMPHVRRGQCDCNEFKPTAACQLAYMFASSSNQVVTAVNGSCRSLVYVPVLLLLLATACA
jgi:hypothetical protein